MLSKTPWLSISSISCYNKLHEIITFFYQNPSRRPKDEVAKSARLLIRAGYLYKEMAGVYDYLPLGLKVLKNIDKSSVKN